MKIELWCQFCKCIHVVGSTIRVLSFPCQPTLLPPTALSSLILDYLFSLFFIFFLPLLVPSHSFLSIIFYHYHNPLLSPSWFATPAEAQAFLVLGLRLCLSSGSRSGVSWFRIAGLSSWQHRSWNLQSSLTLSLSRGSGVWWKIHVCIAYKTYAAEKLMDLLHSQLITCTM